MWIPHFGYDTFPTKKVKLVFVFFINHLENGFGVATFFFKGKQNKKETVNVKVW